MSAFTSLIFEGKRSFKRFPEEEAKTIVIRGIHTLRRKRASQHSSFQLPG